MRIFNPKHLFLPTAVVAFLGLTSFLAAKDKPLGEDDISILPGQSADVYLTYGKTTKIMFKGGTVESFDVGADGLYVKATPAEDFKSVKIEPLVQEAETNLVVNMGGKMFVFDLHIGPEQNICTAITAHFNNSEEWAPPKNVAPMRPDKIDVVDAMDRIEEAEFDSDYLTKHPDIVMLKIGRTWRWNESLIAHRHTTYFRKLDLLVLKFEFHNLTDAILYLHARQYRIRIGNREIPVTVATQLTKEIFPGQIDQVYLFIQGYNISPAAHFELILPPEAKNIQAVRQN